LKTKSILQRSRADTNTHRFAGLLVIAGLAGWLALALALALALSLSLSLSLSSPSRFCGSFFQICNMIKHPNMINTVTSPHYPATITTIIAYSPSHY
jgi:hypothetical protein